MRLSTPTTSTGPPAISGTTVLASPGFNNGRPPGSFALPGIHSVAAAARKASASSESNVNGTFAVVVPSNSRSPTHHQSVENKSNLATNVTTVNTSTDYSSSRHHVFIGSGASTATAFSSTTTITNTTTMNSSGATLRNANSTSLYSPPGSGVEGMPNHLPPLLASPMNGGPPGTLGTFLPPPPSHQGPGLDLVKTNGSKIGSENNKKNSNGSSNHNIERPSTLGSVIGVNPTLASGGSSVNSSGNNSSNSKGKRTRWLLCYPSGGAASSESPSPPSDEAPQGSNVSTPSPTDGGFRIPNSQSNERPTSLPVALLNSSQRNGKTGFLSFLLRAFRFA